MSIVLIIGAIYERGNDAAELEQAAKTYEMLLNKIPGDANLCARIGQVYEKLEDDNTACHWHTEAHRHFPVNLSVISWLGVWYVKREMYEQAIEYFDRAAVVQPSEVKWRLMVASCHRRLGDLHKAFELYHQIHKENPDNIESLQYLEALCRDLGKPVDEYSKALDKLRRAMPVQQTQVGGMTRMGGGGNTQVASAKPTRSERPGATSDSPPERSARPGRSERPGTDTMGGIEEEEEKGGRPVAAPRAPGVRGPQSGPPTNMNNGAKDEDDFADTDVAGLLG